MNTDNRDNGDAGHPAAEQASVVVGRSAIHMRRLTVAKSGRRILWGPFSCAACQRRGRDIIGVAEFELEIDDGICDFRPSECPIFEEGKCQGDKGPSCTGMPNTYFICANCDARYGDSELFARVLADLAKGPEHLLVKMLDVRSELGLPPL